MFNRKYPYVSQVDEMDCGIACLSMISRYYGAEYHLAYLRSMAKITRNGASAWGLMQAGKKIGLSSDSFKMDYDDLAGSKLPAIVLVIKDNGVSHFCVVYKVTESCVLLADPDPTIRRTKMRKDDFEEIWTGITIFFRKNSSFQVHHVESEGLRTFIPLLAEEWPVILKILFAALFIAAINIISSYFLQELIDHYIPQHNIRLLDIVSTGLIICYAFQQLSLFTQQRMLLSLSNSLSRSIVLKYLGYIAKLPMTFFASRKTGEITSRFSDANTLIEVLGESVTTVFLDAVVSISILFFLFFQNAVLFGISLLMIPVYTILIFSFSAYFKKADYALMQSYSEIDSSIIESITGIETLKSLCLEDFSFQDSSDKYEKYISDYTRYINSVNAQNCLKNLIQLVFNVIILLVGARMINDTSMTVGKLMTFNALTGYLIAHLENIISLQTKLQSAEIANTRLGEVYAVKQEDTQGSRKLKNVESIRIDDLSYCYNYDENVINHFSMNVVKGDKIALCGRSGSGKSTLAKMMVRELIPDSGKIIVNGINASEYDIYSYRNKIAFIPQEASLFSGTILHNLTLGMNTYSEARLHDLCNLLDFTQDITKLPNGLEFQVNTDGSGLSGGQRQKLALVRTLLRNPQVLILDESLSAVDEESRMKILKRLTSIPDLTIVSITHDSDALKYFEKVRLI